MAATGTTASPIAHHFTVDVEEYFQVSALAPYVPRSSWGERESRVGESTRAILDLLDRHGARGTFFTLGWIADRHPRLVREIAERGHEVASHGRGHEKVTDLTPEEFRDSVRSSKRILEELIGAEVLGYRAPSFSIVRGREWALDILVEEGYRYDSSLFPIRRPGYGYAAAARDPFVLHRAAGPLREYPPATFQVPGARLPAAGGAYLRLLPFGLVAGALRQAERRGRPATFYIHPWELDPAQPRVAVPLATRIRHYGGLGRTTRRIERLLSAFRFRPIADTVREDHVEDRSTPTSQPAMPNG
jgi:polysaccharide deacetylase family protein (PEP-CTERM system associated)